MQTTWHVLWAWMQHAMSIVMQHMVHPELFLLFESGHLKPIINTSNQWFNFYIKAKWSSSGHITWIWYFCTVHYLQQLHITCLQIWNDCVQGNINSTNKKASLAHHPLLYYTIWGACVCRLVSHETPFWKGVASCYYP